MSGSGGAAVPDSGPARGRCPAGVFPSVSGLPSLLLDSWEFRKVAKEGSVFPNAFCSHDIWGDGIEVLFLGTTEGELLVIQPERRDPLYTLRLSATIAVVLYAKQSERLVIITLEGHCQVLEGFLAVVEAHHQRTTHTKSPAPPPARSVRPSSPTDTRSFSVAPNCCCGAFLPSVRNDGPADTRIVIGSSDRHLYIYDVLQGHRLLTLYMHHPVTSVCSFTVPPGVASPGSPLHASPGGYGHPPESSAPHQSPRSVGFASGPVTPASTVWGRTGNSSFRQSAVDSIEMWQVLGVPLLLAATPYTLVLLSADPSDHHSWQADAEARDLPLTLADPNALRQHIRPPPGPEGGPGPGKCSRRDQQRRLDFLLSRTVLVEPLWVAHLCPSGLVVAPLLDVSRLLADNAAYRSRRGAQHWQRRHKKAAAKQQQQDGASRAPRLAPPAARQRSPGQRTTASPLELSGTAPSSRHAMASSVGSICARPDSSSSSSSGASTPGSSTADGDGSSSPSASRSASSSVSSDAEDVDESSSRGHRNGTEINARGSGSGSGYAAYFPAGSRGSTMAPLERSGETPSLGFSADQLCRTDVSWTPPPGFLSVPPLGRSTAAGRFLPLRPPLSTAGGAPRTVPGRSPAASPHSFDFSSTASSPTQPLGPMSTSQLLAQHPMGKELRGAPPPLAVAVDVSVGTHAVQILAVEEGGRALVLHMDIAPRTHTHLGSAGAGPTQPTHAAGRSNDTGGPIPAALTLAAVSPLFDTPPRDVLSPAERTAAHLLLPGAGPATTEIGLYSRHAPPPTNASRTSLGGLSRTASAFQLGNNESSVGHLGYLMESSGSQTARDHRLLTAVLRPSCLWAANLLTPLIPRARVLPVGPNAFCAVLVTADGWGYVMDAAAGVTMECAVMPDCCSFTVASMNLEATPSSPPGCRPSSTSFPGMHTGQGPVQPVRCSCVSVDAITLYSLGCAQETTASAADEGQQKREAPHGPSLGAPGGPLWGPEGPGSPLHASSAWDDPAAEEALLDELGAELLRSGGKSLWAALQCPGDPARMPAAATRGERIFVARKVLTEAYTAAEWDKLEELAAQTRSDKSLNT